MANPESESRAGRPEMADARGCSWRSWWMVAAARVFIPTLALGLCLGCGGSDESKLIGPPEGMGLAEPVTPPPPTAAELEGSSAADTSSQSPE